ncbi:DNA repair protein RecN [Polynucleobacter paneuropaeus]|uniref:DNA repair protein RecN n=1 Tax=Polynucleobacter paneuropaeus TaxID=2527775 RepID=A0ABX9FC28_9BURK|nr:DNA repair protein RecN [Polynucleobacter paneuropaeus]MBT8526176.1 DNA repair protein RecN [Polynucleobacter paneuropaeus]MBT8532838.1 DNA repair protein RecN [Polynucleobacter paneuropaeus]MBT8535475.1 DNA repair protein RecN [Polynucleobacter paneuropaeus]MBT8557048.1 DNA repair protein RecN [Polynucleobacter paneuropaeus]MBT8580571.1 DNA repair protein RecN [Polynucleobacter paneuropaeus]
MLQNLALRDFVIVDQLELDLASGFTVLTGETGAGKSILLDALGLVLGERADSSQIREGAQRAEISALFEIADEQIAHCNQWLDDQGFPIDDEGRALLLKRTIEANGRSRAFINGSVATLAQLREAGDQLVDIHGQHAHQLLLKSGAQRELLDRHAGLLPQVNELGELYKQWHDSRKLLSQAENAGQDIERERERLEWQYEELKALSPLEGEWDSIQVDHARLANAAKIITGCQEVIDGLSESENSAESILSKANLSISDLAEHDPALSEISQALESAQIQVDEAVHGLNRYLQKIDLDPERLGQLEERMQALHAAARKYRTDTNQLPRLLIETSERLDALSASQNIEGLRNKVKEQEGIYLKAAKLLSQKRSKAATELSKLVTAAMQNLSMAGGQLEIALKPLDEGASFGLEQAEFLVAGHAGSTPRPLAKVASGGELARISLAISVITSKASFTPTLIFDEVDAGIGGAVAETVGKLLRQLGESHQILCVTHLPQVAAQGNQHFKVSKSQSGDKTLSQLNVLSRNERVEEIARMLGGATITDTTRRHARELLEQS